MGKLLVALIFTAQQFGEHVECCSWQSVSVAIQWKNWQNQSWVMWV